MRGGNLLASAASWAFFCLAANGGDWVFACIFLVLAILNFRAALMCECD